VLSRKKRSKTIVRLWFEKNGPTFNAITLTITPPMRVNWMILGTHCSHLRFWYVSNVVRICFYFVGLLFSLRCQFGLGSVFTHLVFQSFGFWRTLWRVFQESVVRPEFDIYVFITTKRNGTIDLYYYKT